MRRFFWLPLILLALAAKPCQITPKGVREKAEEILKSHASHKTMDETIAQRTLQNYIDEFDPSKTYFLKEEIASFLEPSKETIQQVQKSLSELDFSLFEQIQSLFQKSILRRKEIETKIDGDNLPVGVKAEEFHELDWLTTEEELLDRWTRIRALQKSTAERLGEEQNEKLLQRFAKKQQTRENDLIGENEQERKKIVLSNFLKAFASSLDTHTNYLTPSEANQFLIQVQQRLFGIGAQLRDDLDGLSVIRIFDNSPAYGKVKINDKIIAVNNEPIAGMDITEAVELIRGEKGTKVVLTILRDSNQMEIELVRGEVVLEESRLETDYEPYGDGVIVHLKLFSFYQDLSSSSALDARKAIESIQENHSIKAVILDLRGNAGGLLGQAVSVAGLFIQKGVVCSIRDENGKIQHLRELEGNPVWEGPLVILTDRASASSAEIVAQTLQEYGRAVVVGDDRTFGKGSFQTLTIDAVRAPKINPQGEYKVTRGKYYTVSGKSPQLCGVMPHISVPGILSELDVGEKFAKFPLENDSISPHFEDDLSDLSPLHRLQIGPFYRHKLQKQLTTYNSFLEKLRGNSKKRLEKNKNYQKCLEALKNKNYDTQAVEFFALGDLQLSEALNISKDLIFLLNQSKIFTEESSEKASKTKN